MHIAQVVVLQGCSDVRCVSRNVSHLFDKFGGLWYC